MESTKQNVLLSNVNVKRKQTNKAILVLFQETHSFFYFNARMLCFFIFLYYNTGGSQKV